MFKNMKMILIYGLSTAISIATITACTMSDALHVTNVAALTANSVSLKQQLDTVNLKQIELRLPEEDFYYIEHVYDKSLAVYIAINKISNGFEQPEKLLVDTTLLFSSIDNLRISYIEAYYYLSPNIDNYPPDIAYKLRQFNTTAIALNGQYQELISLVDSADINPALGDVLKTVRLGLTLMSVI